VVIVGQTAEDLAAWARLEGEPEPADFEELVAQLYNDPAVRSADIRGIITERYEKQGLTWKPSARGLQHTIRRLRKAQRIPPTKPHNLP
jgi:hypothetical protein